jgi:hypothetical protein
MADVKLKRDDLGELVETQMSGFIQENPRSGNAQRPLQPYIPESLAFEWVSAILSNLPPGLRSDGAGDGIPVQTVQRVFSDGGTNVLKARRPCQC